MLNVNDFKSMLILGAKEVIKNETELTEIDSKFGDADHGLTMTKIMSKVIETLNELEDTIDVQAMLDDTSIAIMFINGGSAVPLWSTLFEGMSLDAPCEMEIYPSELKEVFRKGYENLFEISKAKTGDKTLMDALFPAVEAIENSSDDVKEMITNAAISAHKGAMDTKDYIAKFGRAKSYKEKTLGTPDAGAMGMKYFFEGMAQFFN